MVSGTVELEHVSKRFGSTLAVDRLSLVVRAGEFLALLGGSGCGKTTTLRMLAGFETPDSGAIRIGGHDVADLPPHRRDVNTVFQHYALFPHMTVAENVGYGLRQRGVARAEREARVRDALTLVRLASFEARLPAQLSGGQQQRVAVARAVVNRPAVVLLDEPLGALDRQLRQEMQVELKVLQAQLGMTFVYVTHDQEEALSMADRIAVMERGRVAQVGSAADVYDRPASLFVAGFVGQQNLFTGVFAGGGRVDARGVTLEGGREIGAPRPGGRVTATVRPEAIRLAAPSPGESVNTVVATVVSTLLLGDARQVVLERDGGEQLLVREPRLGARALASRDRVRCTWDREHVHVFSEAPCPESRSAPTTAPVESTLAGALAQTSR
ncbi:MAG: ABC transporter ATP-binding protein [Vicinamibacterales bacterium]